MNGLQPAPTLILGGFLITPEAYGPMATAIAAATGQRVAVVPASRGDWLLTSWSLGWTRLLDRAQALLLELAAISPRGRVNLVGHSSGGVMLRLLLGDEPFAGRVYGHRARVQSLVSLGSPHQAIRGTALRQLVDQRYPGACFADQLAYLAVAGAVTPEQLRPRARARWPAPTALSTATPTAAATAWCPSAPPCWPAPSRWCWRVWATAAGSPSVGTAAPTF